MDGIDGPHLDQDLSTTSRAPALHPTTAAGGSSSLSGPGDTVQHTTESSSNQHRPTRSSRKSQLATSSTVANTEATTSAPQAGSSSAPRPRRSARISLAGVPSETEIASIAGSKKAESEVAAGKRKRRATISHPIPNAPEPPVDRKGKKKAEPSPPSSPLTEGPSDTEVTKPPAKRLRRSVAGRSVKEEELEPVKASSSKGKGKAKAAVKKTKAKMPRKTSTPKKRGGQTGLPVERNKKGDSTPKQLIDDDMEGDDSQWVDERAGPSRSRLSEDEDDNMQGSEHDDEDDDDEDGSENEEMPPPPASGPGRTAYERLARLAGESGMHLDEATAMALFGGDFRNFGGMSTGMSSRFKRLKNNLRSKNISTRLSALRECSELLLVSNEDTLGGTFSTNTFATEFIAILKGQPNIDENGEDAGPSNVEEMDEDAQLAAALAMSTGGAMPAGFGGDNEEEMECQLVACRCLAHLMEALPGTGHTLVHLGAVPVLCSKLNEIAYIELAEQTLSTMEKISAEYPAAIVREGGLGALLNYLPFFSTNVQRTALTAAANCCRDIASEHYSKVKEVFSILRDTLTQADQRLVEQATLAVVRTMEAYRHNTSHLEGLLDLPTVVAINSLLLPSGGSPLVSPATYTHLLRTLTSSARCSATVTIAFLEAGMTNTVYQILTGVLPPSDNSAEQGESTGGQGLAGGVADMAVLQNLAHRPKDQVEETLALICELLPPTPRDGVFDSKAYSEKGLSRMKRKGDKPEKPEKTTRRSSRTAEKEKADTEAIIGAEFDLPAAAAGPSTVLSTQSTPGAHLSALTSALNASGMSQATKDALLKQKRDAETQTEQRLKLLSEHPQLIGRFIQSIVPVLVDVYAASVAARVRTKVLTGLVKAIAFGGSDHLRATLQSVPMASFLGAIISSKDNPYFVLCALQLVELLVVKLKDIYQTSFMREGVVFEIEALAKQEPSTVKAAREKEQAALNAAVKTEPGESSSPAPIPVAGPSTGPGRTASITHILEDLKPLFGSSGLPESFGAILAEHARPDPNSPHRHGLVNPLDVNIFRARVIVAKKLFEVGGDHHSAAVEVLEKLADQVKSILAPAASDGELRDALGDIASNFASVDRSLSSFELLKSGLIDGLLDYVEVDGTVNSEDRRSLLFEVFSDTAISSPSPLVMLVRRLHESLGRLENFEVEAAFNGISDSSRPSSYNLGRTMRIRLQAEDGQDVPKQVNALSVTIQAIAPMQALHDFLRPRVADPNYMAHSAGGLFGAAGFGGMGIPRGGAGGPGGSGLGSSASRILSALGGVPHPGGSSAAAALGGFGAPGPSGIASSAPESGRMEPPAPASAPKPIEAPKRRRSARLSAAQTGADAIDEDAPGPSASAAPAPAAAQIQALSSSAPEASMFPAMPMDLDFDDDYSDEYEEEVFEEDMEEELIRPTEKVVNMSVAPDGSRVEAKTPEGTRVATPSQAALASQAGPSAGTPRSASYAGAVKTAPVDWHLEFSLGGQPVSLEDTIYGAVHKSRGGPASLGGVHGAAVVLRFKKVDGPATTPADAPSPPTATGTTLPSAFEPDAPTSKILRLLRVLHNLVMEETAVRDDGKVDRSLFVNNKLTAKLGRQLEEIMIIASNCLPEWAIELPKHFSFLFPFETRYSFLQATSFGYGRLIARYQAAQLARSAGSNHRRDDLSHLSRIVRQKVRISRSQLLESAAKVLELYGTSNGILEVEYFDEIGTGLGPTLEFYSLASKEFARRTLKLWRDEDETKPGAYVFHPKGLYPSPAGPAEESSSTPGSKMAWFKTIGLFAGRALLDSRIIDINLNKVFLRLILGQPVKKNIATLKLVDPTIARSMERLQAYAEARKEIEAMALPTPAKRNKLNSLSVNGAKLRDLSLDFTLPGYDIELKPGGSAIDVDDSNLEEFLELVLEQTLGAGVTQQAQAFKEGFSMIFPIKDMRIFAPEELGLLIGNADEDWSRETIEHAIKADHGYTLESRAVQNLVEVMAGYDKEERRQFLQFITGAPKLPIGGFRGLTPPFTVVRKPHEAPFRADDYLPSVMTCAQYLKMPDYTSKEALDKQLRRAILDGGGSFHLS